MADEEVEKKRAHESDKESEEDEFVGPMPVQPKPKKRKGNKTEVLINEKTTSTFLCPCRFGLISSNHTE